MGKPAKTPSLADLLRATPKAKLLNWVEKLPADKRQELEELKRDFHAGNLGGHTPTNIFRLLKAQGWLTVKRDTFSEWLHRTD